MSNISNPESYGSSSSRLYSLFMWRGFPILGALVALGATVPLCWAQTRPVDLPRGKFDQTYGLASGEVVKRVLPPFIEERLDIVGRDRPELFRYAPKGPDAMLVEWRDDGPHYVDSVVGLKGIAFKYVIGWTTHLEAYQFLAPRDVLDKEVSGDWVVRSGQETGALLDAIAKVISGEMGHPYRFEAKTERLEVVMLRGRLKLGDNPNRLELLLPLSGIDFVRDLEGTYSDTLEEFPRHLSLVTGWPVIGETDPKQRYIGITWGNETGAKPDLAADFKTPREQLEPLLKALSEQSGLDVQIETREIKRWRLVTRS